MNDYKYAKYTNKIYQIIFLEDAAEYKKIIDLKKKDKLRDTLYDNEFDESLKLEIFEAISS